VIRSGLWKLVVPLAEFPWHPHFWKGEPPQPLLFNVETDVASRHNIAAKHPNIVAWLSKLAESACSDL